MSNSVLFIVCILVAIILFVLAAIKVPNDRVDFIALGLAFLAGALYWK